MLGILYFIQIACGMLDVLHLAYMEHTFDPSHQKDKFSKEHTWLAHFPFELGVE